MNSQQLLQNAYAAFNARDIAAALALMQRNVEWPNGMEGGVVHGHSGVRDYWTRQWAKINPHVEPLQIQHQPDGRYDVEVHQVVKELTGATVMDRIVHHIYRLQDGLIAAMEIRG